MGKEGGGTGRRGWYGETKEGRGRGGWGKRRRKRKV